jgi:preprotein translocase subunit SecG
MTLFIFLTVVQAIVAALLVTVILMQKSEGGGLGTTSGPAGFMSARGAADFMTRATSVLATAFVALSVLLAALAVKTTATHTIDTSLNRAAPVAPADPLAGVQNGAGAPAAPAGAAPSGAASPAPAAKPLPADPLSGAAKQ